MNTVLLINENTSDANAVRQSIDFTSHILPLMFEQLK
jgi:hypothetical protein